MDRDRIANRTTPEALASPGGSPPDGREDQPGSSAGKVPGQKRLNAFERYLSLWVGACMVVGVLIGKMLPGLINNLRRFEFGEGSQINVPIAVLIWLMIIPMMMKVDFADLSCRQILGQHPYMKSHILRLFSCAIESVTRPPKSYEKAKRSSSCAWLSPASNQEAHEPTGDASATYISKLRVHGVYAPSCASQAAVILRKCQHQKFSCRQRKLWPVPKRELL